MNRESASDSFEAVFAALAHPARRRILISLNFAGGAMTAGAIAGLFGHSWPTTTRHLHLLEGAGLLALDRDGRHRIYRLRRPRIKLVADWLQWFGKDPITAKERDDDHALQSATDVQAQPRSRRSGGRR